MSYYYLMTTVQKDSINEDLLEGSPKSNISGDKWILECTQSGLDCIVEYASPQDCVNYINENGELWDEFYNI